MKPPRFHTQSGHAMLIALGVLVVMSFIAGTTLSAISSRYKTAVRTAAWEEALLTAESGVDMTIAQVAGLLPDVQLNSSGLTLATSAPSTALLTGLKLEPGGLDLTNGITIAITPDPLIHGGEGATTSSATVSIDVLPLDQVLNGQLLSGVLNLLSTGQPAAVNLLRLRSTGTVYLPGPSRAAEASKLDSNLLRSVLVRDPITKQKVTKPYVSRQIEVLLKPVFPFEQGVATDGLLSAPNALSNFDSFNSADATTSTNGLYDSAKRRSNVLVSANSAAVAIGGTVYGSVATSAANILKDAHVTGQVNNSYFRTLPIVNAPTWSGTATSVAGTKNVQAGGLLAPAQYKFTQVNGTIHVTANLVSGLGSLLGGVPIVNSVVSSEADIYISGDFTGTLIVDPGVKAKVYVGGNVTLGANGLQNLTNIAANVEILGVLPTSGGTRSMTIDTTGNPIAAIYAPTHNVTLTGNGGLSGALTSAQLQITGSADIHFDEALALATPLVLGYSLVSWQEITTP